MAFRVGMIRRSSSVFPLLHQRAVAAWRVSSSSPAFFRSFSAHPLDPLTAKEISVASQAVKDYYADAVASKNSKLRFVAVSLKEPTKTQTSSERQAEVVTLDPSTGLTSEFVLNLGGESDESASSSSSANVIDFKTLPAGTQPMFTPEDCDLAESIAKNSPELQAALKDRYGITDMSTVCCDPWSINLASKEDHAMTKWRSDDVPGRLVQTFLYHRQYGTGLQDNHYAHPIDLVPVVDLNAEQLVRIDGMERNPPPQIPTDSVNYHRDLVGTNSYLQTVWRQDTAQALNVVQPDGPSFRVTGQLVEWQKWSFRVGFNYREGLVLHDLQFDGRDIAKRLSLVEMAVPYGDPHPPFQRKCAYDVGDYGLGYCANSLELGCDCLGHIHYFDAVLADAAGQPVTKKKAVCMHEEDQGILWKHVEYRNGHNESRRSRELVISSIATVVNYEYLFYWRLKQDGTIDFEIKLSGELSTNLLSADEEATGEPTHGVMVAPGVNSQVRKLGDMRWLSNCSDGWIDPNSAACLYLTFFFLLLKDQHNFCMRLDMKVDGDANTVSEVDVVSKPMDAKMNPYGNIFEPVETPLVSELQAIRTADQTKARTWKISNASKVNRINGKPTAYKLVPFTKGAAQPVSLVDPASSVGTKGKFASANLWVTPYAPDERYPAGEYTPQGDGSVGVQDWTAHDRDLVGQDVVLWHAFGVTHVPRMEDFPVMPCEITGFSLKPDNFFEGNPAIDLPPETNAASKLAKGCCEKNS